MDIAYWHWLALGFGLLVVEMFLPTGFVLIWIGAGALIVGALAWLIESLGWQAEMALFGILSVGSFFLSRKFRTTPTQNDQPALNRRGQSYVNRTFTLAEPIVNGIGKLHVDDSQWRVSGPDVPAGTQVRVVQVDGATLVVERAHP